MSQGTGDIYIQASCNNIESSSIMIEDCNKYWSLTTDPQIFSVLSGSGGSTTYGSDGLTIDQPVNTYRENYSSTLTTLDNFKICFKLRTTSNTGVMVGYGTPNNSFEFYQLDSGNTNGFSTNVYLANTWQDVEMTYTNGSLVCKINNNTSNTISASNYPKAILSSSFATTSQTTNIKDLKIKSL